MTLRFRRITLVLHISTAVSWLGTAVVMLALGIVGTRTTDPSLRLAYYQVIRLLNLTASVPMAFLGLVSGIVLAVRGPFGLVRHRWVLTKLILSLLAVLVSQELTKTGAIHVIDRLTAAQPVGFAGPQVLLGASLSIVTLTVNVGLGVTKPWGMTRWGVKHRRMPNIPILTGSGPSPRPAGAS